MPVKSVQDLFAEELRDIYHAEKQLVKALPKMAKVASSERLREALTQHLEETRGQVERIDQVFDLCDLSRRARRCEAMEGLIAEGQEMAEEIKDEAVRDVGIVSSAQKVEHYEMAAYGSLVTLAKELGHADAAKLLQENLQEEKAADAKLNELALKEINKRAVQAARSAS